MSENEEQEEVKKVKLTKKGKPDQRSIKSAANVSKEGISQGRQTNSTYFRR